MLSNLIHNYQNSKSFLIAERIQNEIHSFKCIHQASLQDLLASFYEITGNSLRSNADIARLPFNDRSILLRTAATNVTCMGAEFMLYHSQLLHYEIFWYYLEPIYGKLAVNYSKWSSKFIDPDPIISKLSIALFSLSTNARIYCLNLETEYTNIEGILNIENRYAQMIWKYLLYKYDYTETIRRYLHIVEWFLALTTFIQSVYNVDIHVNDVESLVEQTEIALILDDVDRIGDNNISLSNTS